nr:MAG TPA: hypothetical protein [Caudoviricetes sp.]
MCGRAARHRKALRAQNRLKIEKKCASGWCRRPKGASAGRFIGKTRFF